VSSGQKANINTLVHRIIFIRVGLFMLKELNESTKLIPGKRSENIFDEIDTGDRFLTGTF